ncbi:MAG: hypothetical protein ACPGNT_03840, partial [Rhodospirillales bacterium]
MKKTLCFLGLGLSFLMLAAPSALRAAEPVKPAKPTGTPAGTESPAATATTEKAEGAEPLMPRLVHDSSSSPNMAVTLFSSGFALVRDETDMRLEEGDSLIAFEGVTAALQPETALLTTADKGPKVNVIEQTFDFDLLTPASVLQ